MMKKERKEELRAVLSGTLCVLSKQVMQACEKGSLGGQEAAVIFRSPTCGRLYTTAPLRA